MKTTTLLLGVVFALCLATGQARHGHKHHKRNRQHREHPQQHAQLDEVRSANEEAQTGEKREEVPKEEVVKGQEGDAPDPCSQLKCKDGQHCRLTEAGEAQCVCMESCSKYNDPRSAICSARNITYDSECEFYRQICLCERNERGCVDRRVVTENDHLDYYSTCKEIRQCEPDELVAFPSRMALWLTNVMETLDKREELEIKFSDMHRRSRRSKHPEIVPILWEFCQMDTSKDRIVTRSELFPLIAPLKPLEHCIGDFLDKCDADSNGEITLQEWGHCLDIPDDNIEDICEGVESHHVRLQG